MTTPVLFLNHTLRQKITRHAAEAYPEECCGVLLGMEHGGRRRVVDVLEMKNEGGDLRRRRFLISPEEYLRAETRSGASGWCVMGFYHSHPDHPAEPSLVDLEHAWPWWSYVIVSVNGGIPTVLRSWILKQDRSGFKEELIEAPRGRGIVRRGSRTSVL